LRAKANSGAWTAREAKMSPLKIIIGCLLFDLLQLFFWIESTHFAKAEDSKAIEIAQTKTETQPQ
jgi:hypothetical protein